VSTVLINPEVATAMLNDKFMAVTVAESYMFVKATEILFLAFQHL